MIAFGQAAVFGLLIGFLWGTGCSLAIIYSIYLGGYRKAVEKRLPGFFIQSTVGFLLFIGAIVGIVMHRSGG